MDNKKWHKRIAVIFWWVFTALPIILFIIGIIGMSINTHITSVSDYTNIWEYYFDFYNNNDIYNPILFCGNISIPILKDVFISFFELFEMSSDISNVLACIFGYMVSIQFYHLLFDIVAWLFIKLHCLLERSSH